VSYFVQDPKTRAWVHTNAVQSPGRQHDPRGLCSATDGCTPIRNPFWRGKGDRNRRGCRVSSTGKPTPVLNSWGKLLGRATTFSIPGIGLNVPIASPTTLKETTASAPTRPAPRARTPR